MANILDFHLAQVSIDNDIFEQFSNPVLGTDAINYLVDGTDPSAPPKVARLHNYCPKCAIPMELAGTEYHCSVCGLTKHCKQSMDHSESSGGSVRISTGPNKGKFYNISGDYAKTQRKMILLYLMQHHSKYSGSAFPINVLTNAANQYNNIQKFITEDNYDSDGNVCGVKKFVRRGAIKDEILAALVYFEGIRENIIRKKRDVALFMGLVTNGFSRGETILRNLEAEGKIDIPLDAETTVGFVDRYMEGLNLDSAQYNAFIIDLVGESEKRKIGMNSQLSSKIVGAIWIIITKCKLNITALELEKAADNTKKNTFVKFYNIVFSNIGTFAAVFRAHNIPF